MRRLFLSAVSSLALAHAATAADLPVTALPVKAPPAKVVAATWTGFYLGVQGAAARHHGSLRDTDGFFNGGGPPFRTISANRTGALLGVNAGYNFQSGNLVYGVEGDWSGAVALKASHTDFLPFRCVPDITVCPINSSFNVHWLATARARLGLAFDTTLFYVTGGAAFGRVNNHATLTIIGFPAPFGQFSQGATKVGWVAGGGIEHKLDQHWTVRAEGRYVDLGKSTVNCTPAGGPSSCATLTYRGEFHNTLVMGLVALDYKF